MVLVRLSACTYEHLLVHCGDGVCGGGGDMMDDGEMVVSKN